MWPTRHTVCLVMRSDRSMLPHIHVVYSPTLSPAGIIMKSNYDTLSFSALVIKRSYFEVRRPIRWYRYVSGLHIRLLNTFPDIFCSYRHAFATTFFLDRSFGNVICYCPSVGWQFIVYWRLDGGGAEGFPPRQNKTFVCI